MPINFIPDSIEPIVTSPEFVNGALLVGGAVVGVAAIIGGSRWLMRKTGFSSKQNYSLAA